jgi:uncharacterized protein (TIGR02996 family)
MDDEAFLRAIQAAPNDEATQLIYADWLEERGDARSEILRLVCQLMRLSLTTALARRLRARLEKLCRAVDPDWVALVRIPPLTDAIQSALTKLELLLSGINYVVELGICRILRIPDATVEQYVTAALGPNAVVGGFQPVTGIEVLTEVERCLRYPGDIGAGPMASTLRLPKFNRLVREVLTYLERSVAESSAVATLRLIDGHPFYPVMWDFAFAFVKAHWTVVFLGSSSD